MIQPCRAGRRPAVTRSAPHLADRARHQQLVVGAQVGAPPDPGVGGARPKRAVGVEHDDGRPDRPCARSCLPVVIRTGSPTSLSGMRCRAVSACTAVMPGMTS